MTTKQKAEMYVAIKRHGENLLALFPNAKIKEPIALCKALRRLEVKAHRAAENWCNGLPGPKAPAAEHDSDYWGDEGIRLAEKAAAILGEPKTAGIDIQFNGDARGYALKLFADASGGGKEDSLPHGVTIYKDWGGYGIIAPDFTPRND